jgi:hypothetical protein
MSWLGVHGLCEVGLVGAWGPFRLSLPVETVPTFHREERPMARSLLSWEEMLDQLDFETAWANAEQNALVCAHILETEHSVNRTMHAWHNTVNWLRYWSMFHPDPRWRAQFGKQAIVLRERMDALLARHGLADELEIAVRE